MHSNIPMKKKHFLLISGILLFSTFTFGFSSKPEPEGIQTYVQLKKGLQILHRNTAAPRSGIGTIR